MKFCTLLAVSAIAATPALAEEARHVDAHEHGVGQLDIAFDGATVAMELHAPGADIVGFEYAAESAEDLAAIEAAEATLAQPLSLFVLPEAAGCSVVHASAGLEGEEHHDEHEDEEHDHEEEHAHEEEHGQEEHAEEGHGEADHADHEEHAEEGHDDHDDHGDHEGEAGHTEFHAEYELTCTDPTAVTNITFAYFDTFPNALEVEVQVISDTGATSFEVERDAPTLDLSSIF